VLGGSCGRVLRVAPSKARVGRVAYGVFGVRRQLKLSAPEFWTLAMTRSPVVGRYWGILLDMTDFGVYGGAQGFLEPKLQERDGV